MLTAQRSGKVKGRASVAFRFDRLTAWESSYDVDTDRISRVARATKRKDATKIGIGAGAGALIGAIAGGRQGRRDWRDDRRGCGHRDGHGHARR